MKLFRLLLAFTALFASGKAVAQKQDKAIKTVINRFFEGMANGDTTLIWSACTDAPVLQTVKLDQQGNPQVISEDFRAFVRFVGTPRTDKLDERIRFAAIHAEQSLASVWTPYRFYLNGKLSHCGTNSFQLVNTSDGWKIQYIIDTRRKDCD